MLHRVLPWLPEAFQTVEVVITIKTESKTSDFVGITIFTVWKLWGDMQILCGAPHASQTLAILPRIGYDLILFESVAAFPHPCYCYISWGLQSSQFENHWPRCICIPIEFIIQSIESRSRWGPTTTFLLIFTYVQNAQTGCMNRVLVCDFETLPTTTVFLSGTQLENIAASALVRTFCCR